MRVEKNKILQIGVLVGCFVVFGALLFFANFVRPDVEGRVGLYNERGRVVNVAYEELRYESANGIFPYQTLEVEVLSGEFRGMLIEASNNLLDTRLRAFDVGDRVIVELTDFDFRIVAPERAMSHIIFVLFFLVLLCIVGGKRGFLSVAGIIFSLVSIMFILIPLTLAGYSSILIASVVGILIAVVTIVLLAGVNAKSISAITGCIFGVFFASIFAFISGHFAFISGYHTEHAGFLIGSTGGRISLSGIFISGVIIAAIGAISDTSMTIASAMEEVKLANPAISMKDLALAGLNVGRDAMGTMSNTLILAFVGSSFSLLLLITSRNVTWIEFLNDSIIGTEIIQGIAGSIGIILTVPITTVVAAKLFSSTVNK